MLKTSTKFQGEDGTIRVYDYPTTLPAGYPFVVVGSESLESSVLDNASDTRRYNYRMQIVGEKFGEEGGLTQSDALLSMRNTEDAVLAIFDAQNALAVPSVIRTMPVRSEYGVIEGGGRVVLTIHLYADTRVLITL